MNASIFAERVRIVPDETDDEWPLTLRFEEGDGSTHSDIYLTSELANELLENLGKFRNFLRNRSR